MRITIYRASWQRGDHEMGALLNRGKRCCLGFLGRACGLSDTNARGAPLPSSAYHDAAWPAPLFGLSALISAQWQTAFAYINDADDIDEPTREEWISTGFKLVLGVDVEFIDGEEPGS